MNEGECCSNLGKEVECGAIGEESGQGRAILTR